LLSHALRRALAACASILLVLGFIGLTSSPSQAEDALIAVSGKVYAQGGSAHVRVKFYRATDSPDDPWTLAAQTTADWYEPGRYSTELAPGTYRVDFDEADDDMAPAGVFEPKAWTKNDDPAGTREFVVVPASADPIDLGTTLLSWRGGLVTGHASDRCPDGYRGGNVIAYAADDVKMAHPWSQYLGASFQVRTFAGPTKFQLDPEWYPNTWIGGDSFETATEFVQAPGSSTSVPDLTLVRGFDETQGGHISGWVMNPASTTTGLPGVHVRVYRSDSGWDGPWTLAGQDTTRANTVVPQLAGYFQIRVEKEGVYRATYNEFDDGSATSKLHAPMYYGGTAFENATDLCVHESESLKWTVLPRSGGTISGTARDVRGSKISVSVEAFDADDPRATGTPYWSQSFYGDYTVPAIAGPVKLRFSKPEGDFPWNYVSRWFGGGGDFVTASSASAGLGESSAGNDVVLADAPLKFTKAPSISGKPLFSEVLTANYGETNYQIPPTGRWLRTKNGRTTSISGATGPKYRLKAADVGARISFRATATPTVDTPGVPAPVSAASPPTAVIRRHVSLWISASSSGLKIKAKAKVRVDRVSKPDGRARISWVRLVRKGNYLYATGKTKSKWISYHDSHAAYTFKVSKKGYWGYSVYLPSTSSRISRTVSRYIKVG
jgi:hypothetical protein